MYTEYSPILAIGIPHCNTPTVVSTAACILGKWHVADNVCNKYMYEDILNYLGPVVQSIVSLKILLKGPLVECFTTL